VLRLLALFQVKADILVSLEGFDVRLLVDDLGAANTFRSVSVAEGDEGLPELGVLGYQNEELIVELLMPFYKGR
jgi:hypothetical protein